MKTGIHPKYYDAVKITCVCGNVVLAGSTREKITTELCSACHPFYTGKQKLVDTAGKVDKFMARVKKAQEYKAKQVKKIEGEEEAEEIIEVESKPAETTVEITETTEEATEKPKSPAKKASKTAAKKPAAKKVVKSPAKKASKNESLISETAQKVADARQK